MSVRQFSMYFLTLSIFVVSLGCNPPAATAPPAATENSAAQPEGDGLAPPLPNEAADAEAVAALPEGLSGLSAEDQQLAIAQKVCPVGGQLGGMGTPVKVEHAGKTYFLCCEHCREPFLKEPEKYLAKLNAAAAPTP